ncbi:MAG: exonuclease SbcCD subunit D [Bacteroides sp.]|nr:exonuclease SbcCD subunit D [Bacteroides sp.]
MKIIHTSDWHIGHQLYGYDRVCDHHLFFNELKEICREETPDAIVVSGDIFDVSSPSAASMRMFTDFILTLHREVPEMKIVITSGNHDSASRIDVNRNLWRAAGIYVIGSVKRINGEYDFSDNIVQVGEKGVILAVPYINPAFMGGYSDAGGGEKVFFEKGVEFLKKVNDKDLPVVLMAHMTVAGCDRRGHREAQIGKINQVDINVFSDYYDYVALGHIHRSQNLTQDGRVRYSGSPLAISFDEDYPHSVSVVEIERGQPVTVREIEILQKRELLTFPSEGVNFTKAIRMLTKLPPHDEAFIRLNVKDDKPLPSDCEERATMATSGKECKYCTIKYEYTGNAEKQALSALSLAEFAEITTEQLARRYFNNRGVPDNIADEYLEMLDEIEREISEEMSR